MDTTCDWHLIGRSFQNAHSSGCKEWFSLQAGLPLCGYLDYVYWGGRWICLRISDKSQKLIARINAIALCQLPQVPLGCITTIDFIKIGLAPALSGTQQ